MEEMQQQTSSNDAGNATGSSSKRRPARGASVAPDASQKINQDNFLLELDSLVGQGKIQKGCSVGALTNTMEEPMKSKFKAALINPNVQSARLAELLAQYDITIGSDVMRRHRRRLMGKDGCRCPLEP
jgi:hypothetical protein